MITQRDDEKFKELILYVAERSEGDANFGATKLNKLLFYIDFLAYLYHGKPISGHEYQKLPYGPAPRQLLPIQCEMESNGEIAVRNCDFGGYCQNRILALRPADPNVFSTVEIDLVGKVIQIFWNYSARAISDQSHGLLLYALMDEGETIPYEVALIGKREMTDKEIEIGIALEEEANYWRNRNAA